MGNRQIPFKIKTIPCEVDGYREERYPSPHANIQVKLTEHCNAGCKFCVYHNNHSGQRFSFSEFIKGILNIHRYVEIPCVTFTGGETTFDLDLLDACISTVKFISPDTNIKIHTNGFNLAGVLRLNDVWRVSLSRHGITDAENYEIFGTGSVPSCKELKALSDEDKNRLHIDCNLIKGHVDSVDKIKEFLDTFLSIGITDFGFVTLMPVNEYCRENFVDSTELLEGAGFEVTRHCRYIKSDNKPHCECCNYIYKNQFGQIAKLYSRRAIDMNCEEASLVFDGTNWKQGFSGPIISYS